MIHLKNPNHMVISKRLHAEERGRANRLLLQSHDKSGTPDSDSESSK